MSDASSTYDAQCADYTVDFADPSVSTGVKHSWVELKDVVGPAETRNPQKVYNLLSAPQSKPLVQILHQK